MTAGEPGEPAPDPKAQALAKMAADPNTDPEVVKAWNDQEAAALEARLSEPEGEDS